jgi:hypothetical protein
MKAIFVILLIACRKPVPQPNSNVNFTILNTCQATIKCYQSGSQKASLIYDCTLPGITEAKLAPGEYLIEAESFGRVKTQTITKTRYSLNVIIEF